MTAHSFCTWIYRWSETERATVRRCFCGTQERVSARPARVTVTVVAADAPLALTAGVVAA